jgi:hypothetical protein
LCTVTSPPHFQAASFLLHSQQSEASTLDSLCVLKRISFFFNLIIISPEASARLRVLVVIFQAPFFHLQLCVKTGERAFEFCPRAVSRGKYKLHHPKEQFLSSATGFLVVMTFFKLDIDEFTPNKMHLILATSHIYDEK